MVRDLIKFPETKRALMELPDKGRQLVRTLPKPVQIGLEHASRRSLRVTFEIFAGLFVVGAVALVLAYGRLSQGPVSLAFLVPSFEEAINRELANAKVKIDDAVIQKSEEGADVLFRLRNIRLIDNRGAVLAQAPWAAVGLSARGLLAGRIAPGSVDFIGPKLLLFYSPENGLALSFSPEEELDVESSTGKSGLLDIGVPSPGETGGRGDRLVSSDSDPVTAPAKPINLTQTITEAFERARKGEDASSFLTRFGVRDAVVIFDQGEEQSQWQVPDFEIDLRHGQKRSVLEGKANISSSKGPWQFSFRTEQSQKQQRLAFRAQVEDLVPKGIASNIPGLDSLRALDIPVSADTNVDLSTQGVILGAEARIRLAAGHIIAPWDLKHPMLIDEGDLHVRYHAEDERVEVLPSTVQWGESRAVISGMFTPDVAIQGVKSWRFRIQADEAVLAADEFGLGPVPVDEWYAEGRVTPHMGRVDLSKFIIKAGGAKVEFAGSVIDAPGSPAVKLAGEISPMPTDMAKQIWPKFVAAGAREWSGEQLSGGELLGGSFRIEMPGGVLAKVKEGGDIPEDAVAFDMRTQGIKIRYIDDMPPIETGEGTVKIRGRSFAFEAPDAWITLPSGKRVDLLEGRFVIDDLRPDPEMGEITFKVAGGASAALELLDHEPLEYAKEVGLKPTDLSGSAGGVFRIGLPMRKDLEFEHITLSGSAQLTGAKATGRMGGVDVEGGTVDFNVTENAVQARGDVIISGIPARVNWQRIFDAPDDKQPDVRVSAVLDAAQREKLGMDVNHMVRGATPVTLTVSQPHSDKPKVQVAIDLGGTDLVLGNVGWRKPPGKRAGVTFEIAGGNDGNGELKNFQVTGDDIAIEGWIGLGEDGKPNAFFFPQFSFNAITQLELAGKLRSDNVWDVQAHGAAYDGRQFFESLLSAGELGEDQTPVSGDTQGLDLTAQIETMLGHSDTTVKGVSISLNKRDGKLVRLDASGQLNGKSPIAVKLDPEEGQPRVVLAESKDAGSAFRLVGFYPKIEGGEASLQVNLDGTGNASTTGTLWARDFVILGDPVVNKVVANTANNPQRANLPGRPQLNQQRRRIVFNQMRAPFSVGGGQFILHDSYINGPLLGATMRGQVDFKAQRVSLGGTYVPLYGLNSALGQIPIIGNILVGRRGEGIVGITFAVRGPVSDPKVTVNPVSVVAPGIFRQIFEFTGRPQRYPAPRIPDIPKPVLPRPEISNSQSPDTPQIGNAQATIQQPWLREAPVFPGEGN